ncbi:MAG: CRISPR-associated helicase Cas3' [Acidobacteria bacterium]|nr:CRISPR-associated helicase Cas3' [Acidobacteriota bacterium]
MLDEHFRAITGFAPANHQRGCAEAVARGESVILRAPTGSGKSEAVWIPFLLRRGNGFPMRMIHALPMRALANQLEERMKQYAGPTLRVAAMHGQRPESVLFYADAIFATLDQVVTSYACAPLSLSVRQGNIPAGAVASSFLVFDEVHTFEPRLGLQSVLVLADRAHQMGIPFVIMSATLPKNFIRSLADRFGATPIEGDRLESRDLEPRRVTLRVSSEKLSARAILDHARKANRTLVVVNTVQRALDLYEQVRGTFQGQVVLAHSRFYDEDRRTKERQIEALFGKKAAQCRCLLIATQVVEVGLDISCDLLITELAPIDALVQRAGRCARWGGKGDVVVFRDLDTKRPYDETLVVATERALQTRNLDGQELTWEVETTLVDTVLDPYFKEWAEPDAAGKVLASLADAAFTGNSTKAEHAVRETLTVEVALHDSPQALGPAILRLPRCRLHPGVFQQFFRKQEPQVWQAVVDRNPNDDYRATIEFLCVNSKSKVMPGGYYIVHPQFGCYDAERGLRLGVPGQSAEPFAPRQSRDRLKGELQIELWQDHITKVVRAFERYVLPKERMAFEALTRWLRKTQDDLLAVARAVLVFHDLGKLARQWQQEIQAGLNGDLPKGSVLAHRGGSITGLPPHATVSAWVATPCLRRLAGSDWEQTLAVPALAAIAHHHSVRANITPEFEMTDGWFDVVADCMRRLARVEVARGDFNTEPPRGNGSCGVRLNFLLPQGYSSYVLLSRWLRLADRIATGGGEETILDYEEWMRRG